MTNKVPTPAGVPDMKQSEMDDAKKEGVKDYVKAGVAGAMASDTGTTGDAEESAERQKYQVAPDLNTTFIATFLDDSLDDLTNRLKDKPKDGAVHIDFETAKGLLALERSGRNRTGYVKALMAAIGVKDVTLVTTAGPPYTNDETQLTAL